MTGDTIFALSSGAGRAAVAVIRISGRKARFVLETMTGVAAEPRRATLRRLRDPASGATLDQAITLFFAAPNSQTGEDIAELQVHGGRAVVAAIFDVLGRMPGLRPAEAGEFARRALEAGKMDLLDLEALADLIDAETEAQRRQAVEGAGSLLRGKADAWREMLLDIRADLEAGIDFSDEGDIQDHFQSRQDQLVRGLLDEMDRAIAGAIRGERLREGYRVALLGPPNAGKSSLLNALARRDVAIVSDRPGTTRDRMEITLDLGGLPVLVSDTAGLQETDDVVEQEGIRRSHAAAREADLTLWLAPADAPCRPEPGLSGLGAVKRVFTKVDLVGTENEFAGESWKRVSVKSGEGIADLLAGIEELAAASFGSGEVALVTRARQRQAIVEAREALARALEVPEESGELRAEEIRLAERALARLVGRVDVEDVLGAIFSRFCIGK